MDSNSLQGYQLEQQQSSSSGLLRYRSAPSSLLANLTPTFTESQALLSRLANSNSSSSKNNISKNDTVSHSFQEFPDTNTNTNTKTNNKGCDSKGLRRMNSGGRGYGGGGGLPPHYPRNTSSSSSSSCSSSMDGSLGLVMGSMGMDQKGFGVSSSLNLLRQNSSPADLFSNVSFQNGFATMKGVGNYGHVNSTSEELSPSMNRLKNQISFSSRTASSLGMLSQISEIGNEEIGANSPEDGRQGGSNGDALHYSPGFCYGSWSDAPQHSENLTGLKRGRSSNGKLFPDVQNGELGNQVHMLSHHLSLPKTSSEMIGMENLLQFPDSVPCKIRAKRGCATHPRSIAERNTDQRTNEEIARAGPKHGQANQHSRHVGLGG
ncbi:transcription factor bHLH130 isoform X2 [Arachis hypogaea]|uniref:transcription factor bHLH130 isoform X2 n=1 Tax=Arachis hypogaea TaxID=3818 RepID=UPI000DEC3B7E|nr:transcription factor bHLH130 isoform X2 [Arachis hypogaea]